VDKDKDGEKEEARVLIKFVECAVIICCVRARERLCQREEEETLTALTAKYFSTRSLT